MASYATDEVLEYDGATGDLIGTFASGGDLDGPMGLTFGPGGNLFVSSYGTNKVIEYDGTSGALIGTFASGGGLNNPRDLTFGPNGNLFVSSHTKNKVFEFDGTTGAAVGVFVSTGGPQGLTFGPNGNLLLCSSATDTVIEYDGTTGAPVGEFASEGLDSPWGLVFGPDGSLFVCNKSGGDVTEYYANSGALVRQFAGGLSYPTYLTFKPLAGPFPQPGISGVAPSGADNCQPLTEATLTRSGQPDIPGAITALAPDGTELTVSFDVTGALPDFWDLVVAYPDGHTATLADALEITPCAARVVTGFDPAQTENCGSLGATVTGTNFLDTASVKLVRAGEFDIVGLYVDVQSSTTITASFRVGAALPGLWVPVPLLGRSRCPRGRRPGIRRRSGPGPSAPRRRGGDSWRVDGALQREFTR